MPYSLEAMLPDDDPAALFGALPRSPSPSSAPKGLVVHDTVRMASSARSRHPMRSGPSDKSLLHLDYLTALASRS